MVRLHLFPGTLEKGGILDHDIEKSICLHNPSFTATKVKHHIRLEISDLN